MLGGDDDGGAELFFFVTALVLADGLLTARKSAWLLSLDWAWMNVTTPAENSSARTAAAAPAAIRLRFWADGARLVAYALFPGVGPAGVGAHCSNA